MWGVEDRLGGVPHGLDVVLMQVVDERGVVPLGVLGPHAGLASNRGAVRDGGGEEGVHRVPPLGARTQHAPPWSRTARGRS